ncbi:PAS domain-containing sensor histidine kinase [Desulfonatronum thiosulfatophilum]|nr:PAS domain-containing sensor histidine kinase [Desulfonatronum thiosulfatophilum]
MSQTSPLTDDSGFAPGINIREVLKTAPISIFTSTPEGRYISANSATARMFGYDSPQELMDSVTDIGSQQYVNPADRLEFMRLMEEYGELVNHEFQLRRRDGTIFWCSRTAQAVRDGNGRIIAYQGFYTDISNRKRIEMDLRESEARFKALHNASFGGIAIHDQGVILECNQGLSEITGFSLEELIGMNGLLLISEKTREMVMGKIRTGYEKPYEAIGIRKNKEEYPIRLEARNIPYKGKMVRVVEFRDITERKQAEQALILAKEQAEEQARAAELAKKQAQQAGEETRRALNALRVSEEKLYALFSSMTEVVVLHELMLNEQGEPVNYLINDCNEAFTRITGLSKNDVQGKPATEAYQSQTPPYLKEYSRVALTGEPHRFETYFAPMDKYFSISAVCPSIGSFATIATDITEITRMQQMVSAKNKELEQLVYVASHDLRSPLVNVDGYGRELEFAVEDLGKALDWDHDSHAELQAAVRTPLQDMKDALHYIRTSTSQMDALLKGLLKLSRSGRAPLNISSLNMNELMARVIAAMEFQIENSGVGIVMGDLPPCRGDEVQVTQVFSNLLGNALKFLDPGRPGVIRINGNVQDIRCEYCVEDNGIGIEAGHQKNIFELFHRLDPKRSEGEGLGLTIVRQVMERLDGTVRVESEHGQGSRFIVSLPIAPGI